MEVVGGVGARKEVEEKQKELELKCKKEKKLLVLWKGG